IFSPRSRANRSSSSLVMSTPSIDTDPVVGASRPAINPSSVDLPLPDGPTIATKCPRGMSSVSGCRMVSGLSPLTTVFETSRRLITSGQLFERRLQDGPDVVGNDPCAARVGVDAVRLIERVVASDAHQKKRNQGDAILLGKLLIDLVECARVVGPEVRRRLHAGKNHSYVTTLCALDDLGEISLQLLGRESSHPVVRTKRDDQHPDIALQRIVQTRESTRRRIAGDAGVDDSIVQPLRAQTLLQHRWKRFVDF